MAVCESRRLVLAAVAFGVLAAGCTGEVDPVVTVTPTTTQSPTTSPTSTPTPDSAAPPERPAAMDAVNADGAAAAAHYAIDVLNFSAAAGDPAPWNSVTSPNCRMCTSLADEIVSTGPDPTSPLVVSDAVGREVEAGVLYSATVNVTQKASPDGRIPDGVFAFHFALSHEDDWMVEAIDVIEQ